MSVEVLQYRADFGPRVLQIAVSNDSPDDIVVTGAAFVSASYSPDARWMKRTDVPAGTTRDLRVSLGAPDCDVPADLGRVTLDLELPADGGGGTAETTEATTSSVPEDPLGTVAGVIAQDCLTVRTDAVAQLSLDDGLRTVQRDGALVGVLTLTAHPPATAPAGPAPSAASATIAEAARTILLRPADGAASWPLGWTVDDGAATQAATLEFVPNNCNPHVVAEDKRGTFLPLQVTLSDGTTGTYFVPSSTALRGSIYQYIADYCRW